MIFKMILAHIVEFFPILIVLYTEYAGLDIAVVLCIASPFLEGH